MRTDEKSWFKGFLEQLVAPSSGSGKLSCNDLNNFFFPKAATGTCQFNLIQAAWNGIASEKNLDFIAMSQYLNGDGKGIFFANAGNLPTNQIVGDAAFDIKNVPTSWKWDTSGSGTPRSADDTLRAMIMHFEKVVLGSLVMKGDSVLPLIDRTNNRIYDALYVTQFKRESGTNSI